jgi:hypothetical protein
VKSMPIYACRCRRVYGPRRDAKAYIGHNVVDYDSREKVRMIRAIKRSSGDLIISRRSSRLSSVP